MEIGLKNLVHCTDKHALMFRVSNEVLIFKNDSWPTEIWKRRKQYFSLGKTITEECIINYFSQSSGTAIGFPKKIIYYPDH